MCPFLNMALLMASEISKYFYTAPATVVGSNTPDFEVTKAIKCQATGMTSPHLLLTTYFALFSWGNKSDAPTETNNVVAITPREAAIGILYRSTIDILIPTNTNMTASP